MSRKQSARSSVKFVVTVSSPERFRSQAAHLRAVLLRSLEYLNEKSVSLDLSVVGDAEMRKVNRATRGKDEPTDVLSFENEGFPNGDANPRYLGEILISPRSAEQKGHTLPHLAVHGLLHLLGYTHSGTRDTIAMESTEQKILEHVTRNHRT